MKYLALFFLGVLSFGYATAQQVIPCATDEYYDHRAATNPLLNDLREQAEELILQYQSDPQLTTEALHIIPVVVHVMYYNDKDIISMDQIESAIEVLNEDFSKTNADAGNVRSQFQARQANMEVRFELAKIDPAGNCTNGVTYTQSENALSADITTNAVKHEINWPNNKYLNIWTVRDIYFPGLPAGSMILGYAAFPYAGQPSTDDGVVIRHDQMGRIGTATSNGRTLTHEVGHYLNLYHPFQGGCSGGDQCADTPPVASASYGCDMNKNSCSNDSPDELDMIENFMDYADDACQNTFTNNQKSRAKAVLNSPALRGDVSNSANLIATGVSGATPVCFPAPDFTADRTYICEGETVQFENTGASYGTTTYNWSASNGSATYTGSSENPAITFAETGIYNVQFTMTNNAGFKMKTKSAYITVSDTVDLYYDNSFTASFENDLPNGTWRVTDDGNEITWETTTAAALSGNKSVRLRQFDVLDGGRDYLSSAPILLDQVSFATLEFSYAWAPRNFADQDQLLIQVSTDCGMNWATARIMSSFLLNTVGTTVPNAPFVPSGPQEWATTTVSLNAYIGSSPIQFRFAYLGDEGNNIYLDNVSILHSIGLEEDDISNEIRVFPNPATNRITISHTGKHPDANWSLSDLNGRTIMNGPLDDGNQEVNTSTLPAGVYLVRVTTASGTGVQKVVIH